MVTADRKPGTFVIGVGGASTIDVAIRRAWGVSRYNRNAPIKTTFEGFPLRICAGDGPRDEVCAKARAAFAAEVRRSI